MVYDGADCEGEGRGELHWSSGNNNIYYAAPQNSATQKLIIPFFSATICPSGNPRFLS